MKSLILSRLLLVSLSPLLKERKVDAGRANETDKPQKVVVFGGHPDDPESGAGGLVAPLTREGHEVICAYGTAYRGGRRFFDRPEAEVRREEATAASKVLGAAPKLFTYAHERLQADEDTLKTDLAWLDEVKPDVVVTHWPLDTHPNHHAVRSLVWQCYKRQGGWNFYLLEVMTGQQTLTFKLDLYLDIGAVREVKQQALLEHKSQGPQAIWEAHEKMHRRRGAECCVEFAESYSLVEAKAGSLLLPIKFVTRAAGASCTAVEPPSVARVQGGASFERLDMPLITEPQSSQRTAGQLQAVSFWLTSTPIRSSSIRHTAQRSATSPPGTATSGTPSA
jgi:LmbE family N-acetylglucosaminyl deacetylase